MENGDEAWIFGLKQRTDLNTEKVILLEWVKKDGRWAARCCKTGELVKVKSANLKALPPLQPVLAEPLKDMVCGSKTLPLPKTVHAGNGRLCREIFQTFVHLALEVYENPPSEDYMAAMFIEHIGKFGDGRLIYNHLKHTVENTTKLPCGIVLPDPFRQLCEMKTVKSLVNLLVNLRRGTIAHLMSRQSFLCRFVGKRKGITICGENPENVAIKRMCLGEDPKFMSSKSTADELIQAGIGGRVTIFGQKGAEKMEFDEILHKAYVAWLVDHVLPTLDHSDAKKGSLGEWHRILAWESQLTAKVLVTPEV